VTEDTWVGALPRKAIISPGDAWQVIMESSKEFRLVDFIQKWKSTHEGVLMGERGFKFRYSSRNRREGHKEGWMKLREVKGSVSGPVEGENKCKKRGSGL